MDLVSDSSFKGTVYFDDEVIPENAPAPVLEVLKVPPLEVPKTPPGELLDEDGEAIPETGRIFIQ